MKRGTLTREAVAQVIDYAADLETRDPADLADLLSRESGRHGIERIEDFEEWYGQQFGEQESTTLRPLRIFRVGLGADERAERMVETGSLRTCDQAPEARIRTRRGLGTGRSPDRLSTSCQGVVPG